MFLGAKKNRFTEAVLLSTHNIGFGLEIRTLFLVRTLKPDDYSSYTRT